jgi:WD40 repeat protein
MAHLANENILNLILKSFTPRVNKQIFEGTKSKIINYILLKHLNYRSLFKALGRSMISLNKDTENNTTAMILLSDGSIATATGLNIKIWNIITFQCTKILKGHKSTINTILLLPNDTLASCSKDRLVIFWDKDFNCIGTIDYEGDYKFGNMILLTNGNLALSAYSHNYSHCLLILENGFVIKNIKTEGIVCLININNNRFAYSSNYHTINLWDNDIANGYQCISSKKLKGYIWTLVYLAKRNSVVSGCGFFGIELIIWKVDTEFVCIGTIQSENERMNSSISLPIGYFAIGSDSDVKIWDVDTLKCVNVTKGFDGHSVCCLLLLKDNRILLADDNKELKILTY